MKMAEGECKVEYWIFVALLLLDQHIVYSK